MCKNYAKINIPLKDSVLFLSPEMYNINGDIYMVFW